MCTSLWEFFAYHGSAPKGRPVRRQASAPPLVCPLCSASIGASSACIGGTPTPCWLTLSHRARVLGSHLLCHRPLGWPVPWRRLPPQLTLGGDRPTATLGTPLFGSWPSGRQSGTIWAPRAPRRTRRLALRWHVFHPGLPPQPQRGVPPPPEVVPVPLTAFVGGLLNLPPRGAALRPPPPPRHLAPQPPMPACLF